jgi:hypothetical protein
LVYLFMRFTSLTGNGPGCRETPGEPGTATL